ncbi:MAG TPA: cysteine synthase A [Desulfonauticus sp.]|jgi:cysteine synthase A|nr:MAG: Cysteine synthase [Desulfonauticus sp. 38_4375]MDK2921124.1 cysteine synthase [Desulfonauticus sp.]HCO12445.1 cysteine synthase A [Desulfonauticus sp.]
MIYSNVLELVGKTPLVYLNKLTRGLPARVAAKLEYYNPASSVKDRIAKNMLTRALEQGLIEKGSVIVEPTSGNTGIGLALACQVLGLKLILTMPESMSIERRKLLKAMGAELILTPAEEGMAGAVKKAKEIVEREPRAFMPMQFENVFNPEVHYLTTGEEIWQDTEGKVDIFVAGVGTGGTLTGVGRKLKEKNPAIKVVAVEPLNSPVLSGGNPGPHKIQGIGAGFIPKVLDLKVVDQIEKIADEEAFLMARRLIGEEGILAGISSGANLAAALKLARLEENRGKLIVFVACDTAERYLSTPLFGEE